jgi:uncharacterized protein YciI
MKTTLLVLLGLLAAAQDPGGPPAAPPAAAREPLFAILFRTGPAWDPAKPPPEQAHFKEHSANLAALRKAGKIVTGGRYADVGLVVVRAADKDAAQALLAGDPSLAAGLFRAEVHPWMTLYEGCVTR